MQNHPFAWMLNARFFYHRKLNRVVRFLFLTSFLLIFLLLSFEQARQNSLILDEQAHLTAGLLYWRIGPSDFYPVNPPLIRLLGSLPMVVFDWDTPWPATVKEDPFDTADRLFINHASDRNSILLRCRIITICLSLICGLLIFNCSRDLFGERASLLGMGLWSICPNLQAWSSVALVDAGTTVFGFASIYSMIKFMSRASFKATFWMGIALGMAALCKYSMLVLIPICVICVIWGNLAIRSVPRRHIPWRIILQLMLFHLIALVVINLGYGFSDHDRKLGDHQFLSNTFQSIQHLSSRYTPHFMFSMPIPHHYLLGLDRQMWMAERHALQPVYLHGQWRHGGWAELYPAILLMKLPCGTLLLLGFSCICFAIFPSCRCSPSLEFCLISPVMLLIAVFSLSMNNVYASIRYLLPVIPCMIVFISRIAATPMKNGSSVAPLRRFWTYCVRIRLVLILTALAWNAVSLSRVHPHQLSYANEIVGGPDQAWRHMTNSNIDWGQDLDRLVNWMKKKPKCIPVYLDVGNRIPASIQVQLRHARAVPWHMETSQWPSGYYILGATVLSSESFRTNIPSQHAHKSIHTIMNLNNSQFRLVDRIGYSIRVYDYENK
jgi:hypothetical protein